MKMTTAEITFFYLKAAATAEFALPQQLDTCLLSGVTLSFTYYLIPYIELRQRRGH